MNINEVINYLKDAKNHTYDSNEKYYIHKCIEALYHMKECNCIK